MITSKQGRDFIIEHEGFMRQWYSDPAGLPSIGVGHLITERERESKKIILTFPEWHGEYALNWQLSLTPTEVECLFTQDLRRFEYFVNTFIVSCNPGMKQHEFDALVSFAFNIGVGNEGLRGSRSFEMLRYGKFFEAAGVILKWHKMTKNGVKVLSTGLLDRRVKEIELFLGDDYDLEYWEGERLEILKEHGKA
jgi:lysozyme